MLSVAEDVNDIIELSSTGLDWAGGTDMFISKMPDSPDKCICIYDTGGFKPTPNYVYRKQTFQIRLRGNKLGYKDIWSEAEAILDALHSLTDVTINSIRYIQVLAMSDIAFISYDDSDRPVLTINFEAHRTE